MSSNNDVWRNLIDWVQSDHGGHVHTALNLVQSQDDETNRGVFATRSIDKGELLIRLPASCVLSGKSLMQRTCSSQKKQYEELLKTKSSWMQCVAAYYHAKKHSADRWNPYLDSLPHTYETLFQWKEEEVHTYLRGTTLGTMVWTDREEDSMKIRYRRAVKPVLQELDLLLPTKTEEEEMENFLGACMCISTRGFHHSSSDNNSTIVTMAETDATSTYQGPFLLPVIDLLNHDQPRACTTLQYQDGTFCMMAERPIEKGEAIVHSYGDSLTSAQLLQTFGFVQLTKETTRINATTTPACLSKTKHLLPACQAIKQSGIPSRVQSKMVDFEEQETWIVADILDRDSDILAEDILIDSNSGSSSLLTDEMITFVCFQFLPNADVYKEILHDKNAVLDSTILDDLYLGILACRSLLLAIDKKLDEYSLVESRSESSSSYEKCLCDITNKVPGRIASLLVVVQDKSAEPILQEQGNHRSLYGWAIRREEISNLQALCTKVSMIMRGLYDELTPEGITNASSKRPKLSSNE